MSVKGAPDGRILLSPGRWLQSGAEAWLRYHALASTKSNVLLHENRVGMAAILVFKIAWWFGYHGMIWLDHGCCWHQLLGVLSGHAAISGDHTLSLKHSLNRFGGRKTNHHYTLLNLILLWKLRAFSWIVCFFYSARSAQCIELN